MPLRHGEHKVTTDTTGHPGPQPENTPPRSLLENLPWRKVLIWGLFLLAIYTLRHLFFIIFMTFLLSFLVRMVVVSIARRLSPHRERPWMERLLTLVTFAGLVAAGWAAFDFFAPRIFEQGRALVARLENTQPQAAIRDLRNRTVGAYLFRREYGKPSDQRYQEALAEYEEEGRRGEGLYERFEVLSRTLETEFEKEYDEAKKLRMQEEMIEAGPRGNEFDRWFIREKAPELFEERHEFYVEQWATDFIAEKGPVEFAKLADKPGFTEKRDEQILENILQNVKDDPDRFAEMIEDWKETTKARRWRELRESPEYLVHFKEFFEQQRAEKPRVYPFDFQTYMALQQAYPDKQKFMSVLAEQGNAQTQAPQEEELDDELLAQDFEMKKQDELAEEWWTTDPIALWIRGQIREDLPKGVATLAGWGQEAIHYAATIPIQLVTALLLTVFITFDMTKIKRQFHRLHETRMRNVYTEIAPGLVIFARLMGRAFLAQGLIAVFNALLTFFVLWLLEVENAFFLCAIVFACSFIPVLGVIISSVPIALMAILQPDGSLWLAAQTVIGIIIIHLIESSLLNPKIVGNVLHVHPFMVLAVLTIGEHFFGIWGLLLAVPVWVFIFRVAILNEEIPGITDPAPEAGLTAEANVS